MDVNLGIIGGNGDFGIHPGGEEMCARIKEEDVHDPIQAAIFILH
jgi:hypothetical protein